MSQPSPTPPAVPKISVVVPFYNVEAYIQECLESVAGQTLRDLEVIMVDDGSADGSTVIAKAFAERDPRFRLVQQPNQGLGPARNTGVRNATGTYLTFLDSDDVLPAKALALMVSSLERTGSDFVTGNVMRFDDTRRWQSGAYAVELFERNREKTHITREQDLMRDRIACNKVFRMAFWKQHGFEFPGDLYEDSPIVIRAHVLARSIDVIKDHIYDWRHRPGSITTSKHDVRNVGARLATVDSVRSFLVEHAPKLVPEWDSYILEVDFEAVIGALPTASPQDQKYLLEKGAAQLGVVDAEAVRRQKARRRLMFHLLGRRMLPELLEVKALAGAELKGVGAVRRGRLRKRWYAQYPFFEDPERAIPLDVYDVTDEIQLNPRLSAARWENGRLHLSGYFRLNFLSSDTSEGSKVTLWLQHAKNGSRITLPVTRVRRPDVTVDSAQPNLCLDWSGFEAVLDPAALRDADATWELHAEVVQDGLKRRARVRNPALGRSLWPEAHALADDHWVIPTAASDNNFVIRVYRPNAAITAARLADGVVHLEGWAKTEPSELVAAVTDGSSGKVRAAVTTTRKDKGRFGFAAALPLEKLVRGRLRASDAIDWDVTLTAAGKTIKLMRGQDLPESRYARDGQEIALTRTRYAGVRVVERVCRPVVTSVSWTDEGSLVLTGDFSDPETRPEHLVLSHRVTNEVRLVPFSWSGTTFTVTVPVTGLELFGEVLPLAGGVWELLARGSSGDDVLVVVERSAIAGLPDWQRAGIHDYQLSTYQMDALELRTRQGLEESERGLYRQRLLQEGHYAACRTKPVRDLVVMDSYNSRQYSDSPRALTEELLARGGKYEIVWVTHDGQFTVPEGCRVVLRESAEHYEVMAQARLVVSNNPMPPWYVKREGQTYLQTWHGTPLKRIAFDIPTPAWGGAADYMVRFAADVAKWDYLVSPQPFSTPIFQRSFRYDGPILETGYPRNDALCRPNATQVAAAVRRRLGIPAGKRVVLYAPTWRDDQARGGSFALGLRLDLDAFSRSLGGDHVLLVRAHVNVREAVPAGTPGVIDVSRYPDIAELYLAADVLITDYSSVMFDFAVTRKPILFFTYDLEHYRDDLRGFYFDFEAEAPGPLLRTSDEVIQTLQEVDRVVLEHAPAYEAFAQRFCPLDDGKASARILDQILPE